MSTVVEQRQNADVPYERPRQGVPQWCPVCRCRMKAGTTRGDFTYYYCQDARCEHFSDSIKVRRPD